MRGIWKGLWAWGERSQPAQARFFDFFQKPGELPAGAEDHAKFVVVGLSAPCNENHASSGRIRYPVQPVKPSKLQNRPPAPVGFTKSSMTDAG
jgi:hypothetical protein